jgi:hypothetical protein
MAGVTVPTILVLFMLAWFVVLRLGFHAPVPIERALVFPLAIVPALWGLWNVLYCHLRKRFRIPLGLHGALVPVIVGPLALASARLLGIEIPNLVLKMFPAGLAIVILAYYLAWKYLVGFLNRVLEVG